ncbi:MAG TPA: cellulose biosynthesis protein BcsG [Elusimicrobiota bacterium]|nr:cellulose biosynthesis protein BcsG [Elusimicrobiota bacterium]
MIAWLWAAYFAVKLCLYFKGVIAVHFWPNLALLLLAMPYAPSRGQGVKKSMILRQCLAVPLGAALFWYDSYLPPFLYTMRFLYHNQGVMLSGFSNQFLAAAAANKATLAEFALIAAVCFVAAKKKLHPTPAVFLALMLVFVESLRGGGHGVSAALDRFYARQAGKKVAFLAPPPGAPPFDIVFIHICSFSWDDLSVIEDTAPALLQNANLVFTRFNSATSYSTPAALRLSRAPCGQVAHDALYRSWPPQCSLWVQLRRVGYRTYAAMNTEPGYFHMAGDLHKWADMDMPIPVDGLPTQLLSFDDAKVLANLPVLERWLKIRGRDDAPRAALFYNTITLHTGGHPDTPEWWKESLLQRYPEHFAWLQSDVLAFENDLARSGRNTVLVIIPEHGAALRGSAIQAPTLRDIPLPRITEVPVAVRFIGPLFKAAPPKIAVDKPESYLAVAKLLSDLISDPLLVSRPGALASEVQSLPTTGYLAETAAWKVFKDGDRYYLLGKDGQWRTLPREDSPTRVAEATP